MWLKALVQGSLQQWAGWHSKFYFRNYDIAHDWSPISYPNQKKKNQNKVMPQVSLETDKCSESSCTTYCVSWSSFFACWSSVSLSLHSAQLLIYSPPNPQAIKINIFFLTPLAVKSNWSELICHKILPWIDMKHFTVCVYFISCESTYMVSCWVVNVVTIRVQIQIIRYRKENVYNAFWL